MPRLIDADRIDRNQVTVYDYKDQKRVHIWEIPTADAVEVVRCKDCEFYTEDDKWCRRLGLIGAFNEDDFCSHGERDMWSCVLTKTDGERKEDETD